MHTGVARKFLFFKVLPVPVSAILTYATRCEIFMSTPRYAS
jgi:hypothetical protein